MTLETNKILGGIGAILMFIGSIPFYQFSTVIALIGAVLVVVAMYGLANYYKERGIFNNTLLGLILAIVGFAVAAVLVFTVIFATITPLITQLYPGWDGSWASLAGMTPDTNAISNIDPATLLPLVGGAIALIVVLWIFAILAAFFVRRSLKQVSLKSSVGLFGTAGLLLLIGAVLTIVLIGVILMWIAFLLIAIAFFQIKPAPTIENVPAPPPPATV